VVSMMALLTALVVVVLVIDVAIGGPALAHLLIGGSGLWLLARSQKKNA
jgi:hypothetical protein